MKKLKKKFHGDLIMEKYLQTLAMDAECAYASSQTGSYTRERMPKVANRSGDKPRKLVMVATVSAASDSAVTVAICAEQPMTRMQLKMVRKIQPELRDSPCRQDTNALQTRAAT
jgi:hypothetical protein